MAVSLSQMERRLLLVYCGWELTNIFLGGVLSGSLVRCALTGDHKAASSAAPDAMALFAPTPLHSVFRQTSTSHMCLHCGGCFLQSVCIRRVLTVASVAYDVVVACSQVQVFFENPEKWAQVLGAAIPQTSNFFLNYVITRAFMLNLVRLLMPRE